MSHDEDESAEGTLRDRRSLLIRILAILLIFGLTGVFLIFVLQGGVSLAGVALPLGARL